TIVGVVRSVRQSSVSSPAAAELYFPSGQSSWALGSMSVVVRTSQPPLEATRAVEGAVHSVDPFQPVFSVMAMADVFDQSIANQELYFWLLGTFATIALVLAVAGIYGVIAYSVSQRTKEFGIRLALGSDVAQVKRMVVWQGCKLALIGLVIGLPVAYFLSDVLSAVLYGVTAKDAPTFVAVALLLAVVGLVASYLPARRVTRVDPIQAMRAD